VQSWGLRALTENVLPEFCRSPFFESPCLKARLHPGARFDISNSTPAGIRRTLLRQSLLALDVECLPFEERTGLIAAALVARTQPAGIDLEALRRRLAAAYDEPIEFDLRLVDEISGEGARLGSFVSRL